MASFKPVNEDHAVTSVALALKLDEFVEPPTLQFLTQAGLGLKKTLPAVMPVPDVAISAPGQTIEVPALQFAVVRPDARPIWAVRFSGFEIVVECNAYTRWADVWRQAKGYLGEALTSVRQVQKDANVLEVALQVGDRFSTDSDDYVTRDLFVSGGLIGDRILAGGGAWHTNAGWFVAAQDFRVLNALNVQAQGKRTGEGKPTGPYTFNIVHQQRAARATQAPIGPDQIDEIVASMHEANKAEIAKLLVPEMLKQIGLQA